MFRAFATCFGRDFFDAVCDAQLHARMMLLTAFQDIPRLPGTDRSVT
jgi:hypothetical protein